jgi:hypothetical protein
MKAAATSPGAEKGKSPLSRNVSTCAPRVDVEDDDQEDDDDTITELETDASTTPTPGSPGTETLRPPRSVSDRRASLRSQASSNGVSSRSTELVLDGESAEAWLCIMRYGVGCVKQISFGAFWAFEGLLFFLEDIIEITIKCHSYPSIRHAICNRWEVLYSAE